MFRTKLTLAGIFGAMAIGGLIPQGALAGQDPWHAYATSLTAAQQSAPFITDTLAPGGTTPVQSYRFVTDTLAPGGGPSVVPATASNGFDWSDAGIGAAGTAAIALLLLGGMRAVTSRRRVLAA